MKVEDMGFGVTPQSANPKSVQSEDDKKRIHFYSFISLRQLNSQKTRVFSMVAAFFAFLQNIFISFWPHIDLTNPEIINKNDYIRIPPSYEENLTNIFFFYSNNRSPKDLYLFSFIIFSISIILFFLSISCVIIFYFQNIVNFQLLYCYNFFIQFICPVIAVPIGFQTGWLISKVICMKEIDNHGEIVDSHGSINIFIAIIVLDSILYIIIVIMIFVTNIFNANSIIVVESYFVSYNGIYQSCLMLTPSFILLLSNVLPLFHARLVHLIMALHVLFYIFIIVCTFWLPFGQIKMNSIVIAYSISILVSDAICYTKLNTKWYRYLIFLCSFIIFYFIMNFFIDLRVKKILKTNKSKEKEKLEELNETKKGQIRPNSSKNDIFLRTQKYQPFGDPETEPTGFEDLSIQKLLFTLRIAIMKRSHVFLDGKLVDLITQKVDTNQEKIYFGRLICYFPDFQSIFFAIITGLKRTRYLPYLQEFLLFQLRYHEICCHSESKVSDVESIINNTEALSIHLRSFWQIIDSECHSTTINGKRKEKEKGKGKIDSKASKMKLFPSFDRLSRSIEHCESKWKTLISFYPNNIQIADEYASFLIECNGDFIGASEWKTIAQLIREGKTFKFNPVHVSFLRAFPFYSREIFPKKSMIKGFDDIDIHSRIDNMSKIIEMPEVRFELQRSLNSAYPISIFIFLFISIASLAFILAFWIFCICSLGDFSHILDSISFIINASSLAQQISKNYINAVLNYGQLPIYDVVPTPDEIFSSIYLNGFSDRVDSKTTPSLIELNGDYKPQLAYECEEGMRILDGLHKAILDQIAKGNNFQSVLNVFFDNSSVTSYYHSKNESTMDFANVQSLATYHFIYYHTMSYDNDNKALDETECYHATQAGSYVLDKLVEVSENVLVNNEMVLSDDDSFYSTKLIIISISYIVLSCILAWISFVFIVKSFRKIVNSLYYFPKNVKIKASKSIINESAINANPSSISLNGSKANNNGFSVGGIKDESNELLNIDDSLIISVESKIRNFVLISLIIVTIINIAIAAVIFCFYFIYDSYKYNFVSISELVHYYSLETSQIIEVLYSIMAATTFGQIVPSVSKKYKNRLSSSLAKVINTHQRCWGYSVRGDCGVNNKYLAMINKLKNQVKCPDWDNQTYHELIGCLSEESAFNAFIDMTDALRDKINDPLILKSEDFKQYIHFILSHLYYDVRNFPYYLMLAFSDKQIDYTNKIQIFGSISIIAACFVFIVNLFIFIKIRGVFKLLFSFTSRVLPSEMVQNSYLMNALFKIKNSNKNVIDDGGTSFLVQESSSPIIFLDRSGLIEFVNNAFAHKFGYEANYIVGQPISVLIEDESALFFIDTLKFFESKKTAVKTILCKKGNGNKTLFDIYFIPVHNASKEKIKEKLNKIVDSQGQKNDDFDNFNGNDDDDDDENDETGNSFVNRITLVFNDKTTERNLERRCNVLQNLTNKIASKVFPQSFLFFVEGDFRMCSICLIKLSNSFQPKASLNRILTQRQSLYELLFDRLSIYPLLEPLDCKNGIFICVACRKKDPVELAIECLNFAFNVVDQFDDQLSKGSPSIKAGGPFFAVIETGGELTIGWSGNKSKKTTITGELIERALKVLDYASMVGTICVSSKTYEYLMQHDYTFIEKEINEEICGSKSIYAIESSKFDYSNSLHSRSEHGSDYESFNSSKSMSFIEKMKEEDSFHCNDDDD